MRAVNRTVPGGHGSLGGDCTDKGRGRRQPSSSFPSTTPVYILYSSGTTGVPKAIVHGAGGTLIQHLRRSTSCTLIVKREEKRVFYFTTCGWMMWNWLVGGLGRRRHRGHSTTVRPSIPDGDRSLATSPQRETASTMFGTSVPSTSTRSEEGRAGAGAVTFDLGPLRADPFDRARPWSPRASTTSTRHIKSGSAARLDLRRYGHRLLLRSRQPGRLRSMARRDSDRGASAWPSKFGTTTVESVHR